MSSVLEMWTIFDHPADYPDHFVVRRFVVKSTTKGGVMPTTEVVLAGSIEQARGIMPPGLVRIVRDDSDPPAVVETWV